MTKKNKINNKNTRAVRNFLNTYFEIIFWATAIFVLFASNPSDHSHYSLCIFKNLGFTYCPGCGLGHSISWLLHGNVAASFNAHPLGIFALPIIFYRIITLAKYNLQTT